MKTTVTRKTEPLRPSESLMLDIIRVSASVMVAIGHLSQRRFCTVWPDMAFLARSAVAVFFVLSGFVIRYVTLRRPATFSIYLKDRASRIYSVVLPALLFTLIAALISRHANPAFYANLSQLSLSPWSHLLENLFFTAQLWTRDSFLLLDAPFWSLNYEVAYYVLYGCAFYLTGAKRWIAIIITMLIVGPKILLLFPVWLIGSFAYDLYARWNRSGKTATYLHRAIVGIGVLLCALAFAVYVNRGLLHTIAEIRGTLYLTSLRLQLGMTGSAISFYGIGLVGTIVFLRLLLFIRSIPVQKDSMPARAIRFIAEGTFPIYLFHYPIYVLIASCIPYNHGSNFQLLLILAVPITFGILIGHPCNLLKKRIRALTEHSQ